MVLERFARNRQPFLDDKLGLPQGQGITLGPVEPWVQRSRTLANGKIPYAPVALTPTRVAPGQAGHADLTPEPGLNRTAKW